MPITKWLSHDARKKIWLDLIPDEWLGLVEAKDLSHVSFHGRSRIICHCNLRRVGDELCIDYDGDHASENNFWPGTTIFLFGADGSLMPLVKYIFESGEVISGALVSEGPKASEGRPWLAEHERAERSSEVRDYKIAHTLSSTGRLACEACKFDFWTFYGDVARYYCEVHHNVKLANGERITDELELSVLCANCHRFIHHSEHGGEMMTVENLKKLLLDRGGVK